MINNNNTQNVSASNRFVTAFMINVPSVSSSLIQNFVPCSVFLSKQNNTALSGISPSVPIEKIYYLSLQFFTVSNLKL